jgi:internalin A
MPFFLKGSTYYDLSPSADPFGFDDLLRRFKTEFPRRSGVFISYSHKDKKWLDLLKDHLKPFQQKGMEVWTDQEIAPGDLWHQEIENRLAMAQVAVLLVTPSFLSSSYVASHELPKMLTAANSEGLVIFWIPIIASSYKETEIAKFQAAHDPSRPLKDLTGAKRAEALVNIASKLSKSLAAAKGAQS